jgi:cytochrome c biogenesis protein CcdA
VIGSLGLAFLAGLLSILSPCVLPLVPIVLGSAASRHRGGPMALAAGVALSFVAIGLFVATLGFAIGLDGDVFRDAGAAILIVIGAVLLLPRLQERLVAAAGPISDWADRRIASIRSRGVLSELGLGILLGAVWSPCVGPTLGAASILAARGSSLGQVALIMSSFGLGAALPLVAIGLVSREILSRWRGGLIAGGKAAKAGLGVLLVALGVMAVVGLDRRVEATLVEWSPQWLTDLTTRF